MDDLLTQLGPSSSFFATHTGTAPVATTRFDQSQQRLQREDATTGTDYLGAMWRQDGITDGFAAWMAGNTLPPDPNYTPFAAGEWDELTKGVQPEFQNYFARAQSAAHARYLKDLILQKQDDLLKLGDLGLAGNIGRFALGAVSPENLLTGIGGGLVSRARQAYKLSQTARAAESVVGAAAAKAGVTAEAAAAAARPGSVVAGIASGGAGNAAFEALRQSVNFESDDTAVLEAALVGAAFTAPFALAGSRQAGRVAKAASEEHAALRLYEKLDRGESLSAPEARTIERHIAATEVAKKLEAGELSPVEALKAREGVLGPELPDAAWLDRYGKDLESRGQAMLDELFPSRVTERVRKNFGLDSQPLALGHDPSVKGNWTAEGTLTADASGNVSRAADMRSKVAELNAAFGKLDAEQRKLTTREAWVNQQLTKMAGFSPLEVVQARVADHKVAKTKARKAEAKAAELQAAPAEPLTKAVEAPAAAPEAPAAPRFEVGRVIDFTNKRTGAENSGIIESVRDDGFLLVRNEDGKVVPVHPSAVMGGEPPKGFLKGSVGAAQAAEIGADPALESTRLSKARMDMFATLNRSKSENVRSLVFELVKDPLQVSDTRAQGMAASEWKSHIKRTIAGTFHRESRDAAREAARAAGVKLWEVPAFYHEFHSMVSRLTRNDVSVKDLDPRIAPMLQRASAAQKAVYAKLLEEAQQAGVKGAENIAPNEFYVNRVWSHKSIREAIDKHGRPAVNQLIANAIKVPGLTADVHKAARFIDAVQRLEYSKVMQNAHLYAQDMGTLRGLLEKEGLDKDSIDVVVDAMFTAKEVEGHDKGRTGNLKYRFDLDETLSMDTGVGRLRVSDLLENDSRVLVDTYANTMGGHIALAKHHIFSEADFQARLKEVQDEAIEKGLDVTSELKLLQDVHANIVGRPMSTQDFSKTARFAAALRGYTRSTMLGQLGLTAAFEMKQAVGLMGFRTFMEQMPSFHGFVQAVRNGYLPDNQLARDIEVMVGFGNEMASSYARAQEIDEGFLGQMLSRIEMGANKASHAVDIMSGNASFTSLTRQFSSMMAVQRLADFAHGRAKLSAKLRERLVGWGVDDDSIGFLMDSIKEHAVVNERGVVQSIDYESWLKNAPGTYEKFQTVLSRMVRDAIQDQDLGETIPFMHSTLGKVFGELKTFFLVAHAKNMLKNISYGDATALQVFLVSYLGEMLAYSTQVSANYAHDPSKRDKLLTPEAIAWAAFNRTPVAGMVPYFVNTGYQVATGGKSLVGPDVTANTGNRTLVPPSLITLQRLYATPSTAMGMLLNNGQVTSSEVLNSWKATPLNNMLGFRNLGDILSNAYPRKEVQGD